MNPPLPQFEMTLRRPTVFEIMAAMGAVAIDSRTNPDTDTDPTDPVIDTDPTNPTPNHDTDPVLDTVLDTPNPTS